MLEVNEQFTVDQRSTTTSKSKLEVVVMTEKKNSWSQLLLASTLFWNIFSVNLKYALAVNKRV